MDLIFTPCGVDCRLRPDGPVMLFGRVERYEVGEDQRRFGGYRKVTEWGRRSFAAQVGGEKSGEVCSVDRTSPILKCLIGLAMSPDDLSNRDKSR